MDALRQWSVSAPWEFRDTECTVSADVRDDVLIVQVEEKFSADQWKGQFNSKHIEELTSKTGNFKQFAVFLNMLESAITKSSDSVSLDLLTYSDLEAMRNKKLGAKEPSPAKSGRQLHSKRYLILTYTVEFDRIHYPLALPYAGKPDPALLQETIRKLQTELERYKKQALQGQKHTAMARLQKEYDALLQEKEELEEGFEAFRQEVVLTRQGNASKELRILKKVIKNLEADILKERTKHQRYANKKNEEVRALLQELDEVRSSERTLRTRVKSLTNELAVLRSGLRCSPSTFRSARSSSSGTKKVAALRRRSSSNERRQPPTASRTSHFRIRTPSPSGARVPRFDPSAYIENKKRKQLDSDTRLGRVKVVPRSGGRARSRSVSAERPHLPPRPSPSSAGLAGSGSQFRRLRTEEARGRPRTSSVGSDCSRGSSRRSSADLSGSGSSVIVITSGHRGSNTKSSSRQKRKRGTRQAWESPTVQVSTPAHSKRKATQRTASHNDSSLLDHSAEISEIDARLNALQHFMKRSLEATKAHSNK